MFNKVKNILKAAIISLIVAFIFIVVICGVCFKFGKEKFNTAITLLNMLTVTEDEIEQITPVLENGILLNYPTYGTKYATLKIESAGIELPVYYGANYTILKSGIAHDDTSYFPGEGGSIIMAGHNFKSFLANLPSAQIGDKIELETTYGNFVYEIYDTKIIQETAVEEVPLQKEKEILMIYTCWPINNIGHASQRYVVYAELVKE
jgi:LPXTG-site transpeptidase (sortase) family protein